MPLSRTQGLVLFARAYAPWRRLLGRRTVRRTVQGVELALPWSHLLPDYARSLPDYGQNLVRLAAALGRAQAEPLQVLDVGANVGDSALQVLRATDARVLCVEGDPYWVDYLLSNVGGDERVHVEQALLTADAGGGDARPVRARGTTRFEAHADGGALAPLSTEDLRARHPDFDALRLVKSDTDGFDHVLVPALARTWADSGPVLFFEFDPRLAGASGAGDPQHVWQELADLGYSRLAVWDNLGDPLGQMDVTEAAALSTGIDPQPWQVGFHFWDVAAARGDDAVALAAFDALVPGAYRDRT